MKTHFTFATTVALALIGSAQAQVLGAFSAAPLWPQDGDISRYPGQFVFLNPASGEYVVAIVAPDGHIERQLHAPIHNQVAPEVSVATSIDQHGRYHYRYSLSNGRSAAMPIQRWALAIEETYKEIDVSHSTWPGGPVSSKLPGIARADHQVIQWQSPADQPLGPGQTIPGFEVVSNLAPGYILGAFYGKASTPELNAEDWQSLPPDVAAQLRRCLNTGWDAQTAQIIGPRFAREAPALDMVQANFLAGLRSQEIAQRLPAESAAVSRLERLLSEGLNSPGTRVSSTQLDDLARGATPREVEIISALKLTLDSIVVRR